MRRMCDSVSRGRPTTRRAGLGGELIAIAVLVGGLAGQALAAVPLIRADKANVVSFSAQEARFVRFVILATNSNSPCIDELEVYGPGGKQNLALDRCDATASASSCLAGYDVHKVSHLNDGRYGNQRSWVAAGTADEWAQIELPKLTRIDRVVFSRDRSRHFGDRVPTTFEIRLSNDGKTWRVVTRVESRAASAQLRSRTARFGPTRLPGPPPPLGVKITVPGVSRVAVARGDKLGFANLALDSEATPAASSVLPGHAIHQIAHLNDGQAGNGHSWISRTDPSWAEIDLGKAYWVYKVAFGSDSSGGHSDRAARSFRILVAAEYAKQAAASTWKTVCRQDDGAPVHVRTEFKFKPVRARWVRVAVESTNTGNVRIDEIEVYGQAGPISADRIGPVGATTIVADKPDYTEQLRDAFLGEEHAWLKTYGRAGLSPRLVPYNGRVKQYPRHVGDDRVPLPPLSSAPDIDGRLDDACWREASRGVARVAYPYDFATAPCVEHAVTAGWKGSDIYVAVRVDRILSSHVAVISTGDWRACGIVVHTKTGLVFNSYSTRGKTTKRTKRIELDSAVDNERRCFEFRVPMSLLPGCREQGVRVGLGMGGRYTPVHGRPVHFAFSSLAVAEDSPCLGRTFRVRFSVPAGAKPVRLQGNAPGLSDGLALAPGESKTIEIPAKRGPIGSEYDLTVQDDAAESYTLKLFRYDPIERTLALMKDTLDRFSAKGIDVGKERQELVGLLSRQAALGSQPNRDVEAERKAFFDARIAKRRLFLREPDLDPIAKLLFVKRRAFRPSHNYSTCFDAPFRPGGGICTLDIPRTGGRFEPGRADVKTLFNSGSGIARNPMADFGVNRIYFAHRPSRDGYYHIFKMNPDGSGIRQLTDGPFHDYWPCPLPDGDLAFITTRCKSRALCWRPQAAILFRMDTNGENMEPISLANLTEWTPSVMSDGRLIWMRWEYLDKGADFGHTLWAIRPDGTHPELVFGNTIIQPNGYANGREVPGTNEICCTLISHFGDLNGPIALLDLDKGRRNPDAITSITPEVPWPGNWPIGECFRDPVPIAKDYFLCSHAPRTRFGIYVIDRFGNREMLSADPDISSMCPTVFRPVSTPPVIVRNQKAKEETGEFVMVDVYRGLSPRIKRGQVKYIRVVQEVRANLEQLANGKYREDHPAFIHWYASPVDKVSGPFGWPTYVAKAPFGIVPVEQDGSARFRAPAGKTLYFQALDKDYNELQRMRSVVQLQPGEVRSCIGCHEDRRHAPPSNTRVLAMSHPARELEPAAWGEVPFSFERIVQPVLDAKCVRCHNAKHKAKLDYRGILDTDRIPTSYKTLVRNGLVHYVDCGYNSGGCEKLEPLTFGTVRSKLWHVLSAGHNDVKLSDDEVRRIKTWIDMNCPLWPDYVERAKRPGPIARATGSK